MRSQKSSENEGSCPFATTSQSLAEANTASPGYKEKELALRPRVCKKNSDLSDTEPAKSTTKPSQSTRVRSFGGCFTCRTRKVKCDETHPLCLQCERSKLVCAGYEAKIRFILHHQGKSRLGTGQTEHDGGHGRRMLFTEDQRQLMSQQLTEMVHLDEIDACLSNLESELLDNPDTSVTPSLVHAGPFAIFRADGPRDSPPQGERTAQSSYIAPPVLASSESNTITSNAVISGLAANSEEDLGHVFMAESNMPPTAWLDSRQLVQQFSPSLGACVNPISGASAVTDPAGYLSADNILELSTQSPLDTSITSNFAHTPDPSIMFQSQFLLNHYKSQMGKIFSPLRSQKPPWSILHFPRALSAFSELAVFKKINHAHAALFYAVLAVSAFNWDNLNRSYKSKSTYWRCVGGEFWLCAKRQLELSGEAEFFGESKAKYKDILMSMLTMVTIAVITGQQDEARSFLLSAELIISVRGISKAIKSRKVKLLHCIYLYLRIIEESTFMYPLDRQPLGNLSVPLDQMLFPSLRTNSLCVGRDVDQQCGTNIEHGLFEDPGVLGLKSGLSVFAEIYGIPGELLSYVSRITFLANEAHLVERISPDFTVTFNLQDACQKLETEICEWEYSTEPQGAQQAGPVPSVVKLSIMPHLIIAFHSAVLIFFYRRIRKVHPLMLQHWVNQTIAELELYEYEQHNFSIVSSGIVWPLFIAGAEAMGEPLQARFLKTLYENAESTGMWNFGRAADILKALWEYRQSSNQPLFTWMDFVRERRLSLVAT
ncbi:Arginine metabolism regulation protein II [Ceratocystis fimbriata CBS 114723]|uniref:Arginine metabolism regulation protein II n=1 Tax=Ceratocystis fimbriata CBS 114723 TaxID=1035309 RepID=A0A2C5WWH0_9PEZI|nr:Arginine metabolism regulation protein II [Ceratocystis fimbriata CBS 114723]